MLLAASLALANFAIATAARLCHLPAACILLPTILGGWFLYCAVTDEATTPRAILRLGGLSWTREDFCRGWIVTGETGSGKTLGAINAMLWQVSRNCPGWGGVCIDDKGLYWETLSATLRLLGRADDLVLLKVRPEVAHPGWQPEQTFNFLDYPGLSYAAKAKNICDVAASHGQGSDQPFFRVQAHLQIEFAFRLLLESRMPVNVEQAYQALTDQKLMAELIATLREKGSAASNALIEHYENLFVNQPQDQLGGVRSTVINRLQYFTDPDLAAVFCAHHPTFDFRAIDRGKVVCVAIPQRFQAERRYLHTLLKLLFASHALLRFDRPAAEREKDNLLIFWGDEAQKVVTANDEGTSDYNIVDVIREARATMVFATQSYSSLIPPVGDETKAKVLIANLANRITFKVADEDSAKVAADSLGKHKVRKITHNWSGGRKSVSWTEEEKYHVEPHDFRRLKKFQAIVQHCEQGFRRVTLPPRTPDGQIASWYNL